MMELNKNQLYAGFEYKADCEKKIDYIKIFEDTNIDFLKNNSYNFTDITIINKKINKDYYKEIKNGKIIQNTETEI